MFSVKLEVLGEINVDYIETDVMSCINNIPKYKIFKLNKGDIIKVVYSGNGNFNKIVSINDNSYVELDTANGSEKLSLDSETNNLIMTNGLIETCFKHKLLIMISRTGNYLFGIK